MKIIKFFRRLGMFLLFLTAFYVTVTSITNVTFADVHLAIEQKGQNVNAASSLASKKKQIALKEKVLQSKNKLQTYISSEEVETPKTLEESIQLDQYPSKTVVATGYTAGVESTGKTPDHPQYGITFSGVYVKRDLYSTIAADTSVFPIGTVLFIPNYGYGVVADTGSAIKGNRIDLYYETVEDVYNEWGKKEVEVYVVEEGNGDLTEEALNNLNENEALQVFRQQINQK